MLCSSTSSSSPTKIRTRRISCELSIVVIHSYGRALYRLIHMQTKEYNIFWGLYRIPLYITIFYAHNPFQVHCKIIQPFFTTVGRHYYYYYYFTARNTVYIYIYLLYTNNYIIGMPTWALGSNIKLVDQMSLISLGDLNAVVRS